MGRGWADQYFANIFRKRRKRRRILCLFRVYSTTQFVSAKHFSRKNVKILHHSRQVATSEQLFTTQVFSLKWLGVIQLFFYPGPSLVTSSIHIFLAFSFILDAWPHKEHFGQNKEHFWGNRVNWALIMKTSFLPSSEAVEPSEPSSDN